MILGLASVVFVSRWSARRVAICPHSSGNGCTEAEQDPTAVALDPNVPLLMDGRLRKR